jgi:hypothetical protein
MRTFLFEAAVSLWIVVMFVACGLGLEAVLR